ncbi:MAG: DMT family transporter [Burkholderiales bacterium]|nr:DMT family transporter [Burkholderiales bacterium]
MMIVLCMCWGFNQITIKVAAAGISPIMQAGLRSIIATALLLAWAQLRGIPLFRRDGTLAAGMAAGALFAAEFVFIYAGLAHTAASRMVVFVYLAPCLTALGLQWFVPGERLNAWQWTGVMLAFLGVALAFADGFSTAKGSTLIGDAFGAIAAALWAATTVVIRSTRLTSASATKTLFYQLGISALALPLASLLAGEPGIIALTPKVVASLAYQSVIVAFASYLAWFWLLTRYLAGRLAVFSFLTPLFGVAFGVVLLSEPLSAVFLAAALLVGAGIALVNRPAK